MAAGQARLCRSAKPRMLADAVLLLPPISMPLLISFCAVATCCWYHHAGTPRHYAYIRRKAVEYMRTRRQVRTAAERHMPFTSDVGAGCITDRNGYCITVSMLDLQGLSGRNLATSFGLLSSPALLDSLHQHFLSAGL